MDTASDLDIVVSSPSREATQSLFQLRAQLQRTGVADNVRVNHRAKVPILTFTSLPAYGEPYFLCLMDQLNEVC